MDQHLAIGAGLENGPGFLVHQAQGPRIHEVPVMRNGPDAVATFHHQRLDILDARRAGRGIADVADSQMSRHTPEHVRGKHVVDLPDALGGLHLGTIGNDDSRPFLAAMLQ